MSEVRGRGRRGAHQRRPAEEVPEVQGSRKASHWRPGLPRTPFADAPASESRAWMVDQAKIIADLEAQVEMARDYATELESTLLDSEERVKELERALQEIRDRATYAL